MAQHRQRLVFERRCQTDLLYQLLTTNRLEHLTPHVLGVHRVLNNRRIGDQAKRQLASVRDGDDALRKHALVLFALHAEPSVKEFFGQRSCPKALGQFTQYVLPALVTRVATGIITLQEFVRCCRNEYITM